MPFIISHKTCNPYFASFCSALYEEEFSAAASAFFIGSCISADLFFFISSVLFWVSILFSPPFKNLIFCFCLYYLIGEESTNQKSCNILPLYILYAQLTEIRFSITMFFQIYLVCAGDPENTVSDISEFPEIVWIIFIFLSKLGQEERCLVLFE